MTAGPYVHNGKGERNVAPIFWAKLAFPDSRESNSKRVASTWKDHVLIC